MEGWPEPCIYTVYDRIFDDFPARNTVYTPYIYGSGQPYTCYLMGVAGCLLLLSTPRQVGHVCTTVWITVKWVQSTLSKLQKTP